MDDGSSRRQFLASATVAGLATCSVVNAAQEGEDQITTMSAKRLAALIRNKELTSQEVVRAYVDRIKAVNPKLNAIVQPESFEHAMAEAERCDDALKRSKRVGPLHGVPITIKDNLETKGIATTAGAPLFKNHKPTRDATVVRRLREAGAIVLGKTNLPMLAAALETSNALYGRTNNPYDLKRTPGGSSGGEAAIIAAGGSPLGIGNDAGASIRVPAHFCGIAGLCPSYGRVSTAGQWPPSENLGPMWYLSVGPMARHVEDLKLTLPIISGLDDRDPFTFSLCPLGDAPKLRELRVAYWIGDDKVQPSEDTRKTIKNAAQSLKDLGVQVSEEIKPPYDLKEFSRILLASVVSDVDSWRQMVANHGGEDDKLMQAQLNTMADIMKDYSDEETARLRKLLPEVRSSVMRSVRPYDAIICPVTKTPAVPHLKSLDDISNFDYPGLMGTAWSLPSGTVRCGTSKDGLPIGVQIVGKPNREDIVLTIAEALEKQLGGWQPPML